MNDFYGKAGLRIRELRETNNMTRETLSEIAEISPKFLYEIETGQKGFSADTLYRIAKALSVTTEYILSGYNNNALSEEVMCILGLFDDSQMVTVHKLLKTIYELSAKTNIHN